MGLQIPIVPAFDVYLDSWLEASAGRVLHRQANDVKRSNSRLFHMLKKFQL